MIISIFHIHKRYGAPIRDPQAHFVRPSLQIILNPIYIINFN